GDLPDHERDPPDARLPLPPRVPAAGPRKRRPGASPEPVRRAGPSDPGEYAAPGPKCGCAARAARRARLATQETQQRAVLRKIRPFLQCPHPGSISRTWSADLDEPIVITARDADPELRLPYSSGLAR